MQRSFLAVLLFLTVIPVCLVSQGRFSGLSFFDYYYNVARPLNQSSMQNVAVNGAKDMQAFQIRRLYFTYDDDISKEFTTRFRLDADQSALTTDGRISVYLKDASLTWKDIFHGSSLSVGLQPTLPFDVIESVWGYRAIEKTILDLRGMVATRDMGVSLKGKIDDGGIVQYGLLVGNNSASRPASSKYKRYYAQLIAHPVHNLVLAAYADYNDRAPISDPYNTAASVGNGVLTFDGLVGFMEPGRFSAGIEVSNATMFNGYDGGTALTNLQALGISVFGSVDVASAFAVVGRFDYFDPNINASARGDSRNYAMGGISWNPSARVSIIPNVLYEMYEKLPDGTTTGASLTSRLTVYYIFL